MVKHRNICIIETNLSVKKYQQQLMMEGLTDTISFFEIEEKEHSEEKRVVIIVSEKELADSQSLETILYFSNQLNKEIIILTWDFNKFKKYYQNVYRKIKDSLFMIKKVNQTVHLGAEIYKNSMF